MANRPKKYKKYLDTGSSPPRSTKYDQTRKRRISNSSSSSTDDMEEFYDSLQRNVQDNVPRYTLPLNNEVASTSGSEQSYTTLPAQYTSINTSSNIISCSDDDLLDLSDNDIPVPMETRIVDEFHTTEMLNSFTTYDSDDTDTEMEFWKEVEERKFIRLDEKLINGELNNILPAEIVVSQADMLCGIENFCSKYCLPTSAFENMCKLFNSFLNSPVLPNSTYEIDKLLRSNDNAEFHAICHMCKTYLRPYKNTEINIFCENCKIGIPVRGNNSNFFVLFNIKEKVRQLLEENDQYFTELMGEHNCARKKFQDIYDGLKYKKFVSSVCNDSEDLFITVTFNSDGSPVWKSTTHSIWPIQIIINELPSDVRFNNSVIVALWYGKSKPSMNIYIKAFVNYINRINVSGVTCKINDRLRKIRIYPICCCVDSVARAPMQSIIQFNGYFGCNWCLHPGVPVLHKKKKVVKYPLMDYVPDKRSVSDTINLMKESLTKNTVTKDMQGITGMSPLVDLPYFNIIEGFVPDEMHIIYLGICRQFAYMWFNTSGLPYSIKNQIAQIDKILTQIQTPKQITRASRLLSDRKHWKAREWENWLLYYSLPILQSMPNFQTYTEHWQLLVEAIYILKMKSISRTDLIISDKYLKKFVAETEKLYGKTAMTYNIHQLLHLVESVINWGPVSFHNGYPFESGNGKILNMIKSSKGIIHQICRKLEYRNSSILLEQHILKNNSPILKFIFYLKNNYTDKSIKIGNHRYFGSSFYTDVKWINLKGLNENFTKSYYKMIKDNCIFSRCKNEDLRSNNCFAQTDDGTFIKILEFIVDRVNVKEYTVCNYIETQNIFLHCQKIQKIVDIQMQKITINTKNISSIAVRINTPLGQYISAVPNMLHY